MVTAELLTQWHAVYLQAALKRERAQRVMQSDLLICILEPAFVWLDTLKSAL
jgi:hypothetical protein